MPTEAMTSRDTEAFQERFWQAYGMLPNAVERVKSVYRIQVGQRTYFWKPVRVPQEQRIAALYQVTSAVRRFGLRVAVPLPTLAGAFVCALRDPHWGYLQSALTGRHADFTDRRDRLVGVAAAAHLHTLASALPAAQQIAPVGPPLMEKLRVKRAAFVDLLPAAASRCDGLRTLPPALQLGLAEVASLPAHETTVRRFCHRDLAPHNMLVDDGTPGIGLIDFDLAGFDHPFADLIQVANHALVIAPGEPGLFADVISVYRAVAGLSPPEERLLWRLFMFPDVLIRTVLEWARCGYPEAGVAAVVTGLAKEEQRYWRLAEECPFRLY